MSTQICLACKGPLPSTATHRRKYCSTACSVKAANKASVLNFSVEQVQNAVDSTNSVVAATANLNVSRRTFTRYLSIYNIAPKRLHPKGYGYKLEDILNGQHPSFSSSRLLQKLIEAGIKKYECECCKISTWCERPITLELNHVDGEHTNHRLENLQILCPNCHSQTDTYRSKKLVWMRGREAYAGCLENNHTRNGVVGSNPTASAGEAS